MVKCDKCDTYSFYRAVWISVPGTAYVEKDTADCSADTEEEIGSLCSASYELCGKWICENGHTITDEKLEEELDNKWANLYEDEDDE